MPYVYKNGMRYLAEKEDSKLHVGYHYHRDISAKIGTNVIRTLSIYIDNRVGAGTWIPLKVKLKQINFVKLNKYALTNKLDYVVEDNSAVAFTFNLTLTDQIEIEGYVDADAV